ncbi:hypothetical protein ACVWZZ_006581 [Bradyrhizobium sp. LM6.10]
MSILCLRFDVALRNIGAAARRSGALAALLLVASASPMHAQTTDARADNLEKAAKIILENDKAWTPVFSPSIRLKSFDVGLSDFVSRLAPPDFNPGRPTSNACGMQRFQMKLFDSGGGVANEFAVLLDPQTAGSPVKPGYLLVRTEVLHVDSDGSPRSYHPEDPLGRKPCTLTPSPNGVGYVSDRACAMDKIGNARIRVFRSGGELKKDELATAWTGLWPRIRDKVTPAIDRQDMPPDLATSYYGYEDRANDLMAFLKRGIIPETNDKLPCVRKSASRFKGYFVAATALTHKEDVPGADIDDAGAIAEKECSPLRFLDAAVTPFFVLPGRPFGAVGQGDIAILYAVVNGQERVVHAVIGDSGPTESFGEASVALLQLLKRGSILPVRNNAELKTWDIDGSLTVTVLLLGNTRSAVGPRFTRDAIDVAVASGA